MEKSSKNCLDINRHDKFVVQVIKYTLAVYNLGTYQEKEVLYGSFVSGIRSEVSSHPGFYRRFSTKIIQLRVIIQPGWPITGSLVLPITLMAMVFGRER